MQDLNNKYNSYKFLNQSSNLQDSIFNEEIYENNNLMMTFNSSGEERYFNNFSTQLLNKKRKNNSNKKGKEKHSKFSFDNLTRECKHLVIENIIKFINEKIYIAYDGNIGDGLFKKVILKLNQNQKKEAKVEFNKLFMRKTLREILSENITKRIKYYKEDHNKQVINSIIEEKKDIFESLFNLTFLECVEHFIGNKEIKELNGLTLFSEVKEQILKKHKKDGESYYKNLEFFMKEFEKKIDNARPKKRRTMNI